LRNIVHLLFGVAGLVAARAARTARVCLIVGESSIWSATDPLAVQTQRPAHKDPPLLKKADRSAGVEPDP